MAVGRRALEFATSGNNNVVIGWRAGDGLTTGDDNTFIGDQAGRNEGPTVSNVICLGSPGDTNGGHCTQPNLYRQHSRGACGTGDGHTSHSRQRWPARYAHASSRRFKKDIQTDGSSQRGHPKAQAGHVSLQESRHQEGRRHAAIWFDCGRSSGGESGFGDARQDGKITYVRYDAVNVMLLNEFLKEHKKVEEQQASIADLKSTVALQQKEMQVLTAQLKEQAAQIQKVSAQLEASKPAPKVVVNR